MPAIWKTGSDRTSSGISASISFTCVDVISRLRRQQKERAITCCIEKSLGWSGPSVSSSSFSVERGPLLSQH